MHGRLSRCMAAGAGWEKVSPEGPALLHGPEYLLAAAAGLADIAEELKTLLGGCTGNGGGGRGGVPGARSRREGRGVESPAVATLQDGDLQGAPSPPHLQQTQAEFLPSGLG